MGNRSVGDSNILASIIMDHLDWVLTDRVLTEGLYAQMVVCVDHMCRVVENITQYIKKYDRSTA